MLRTYCLRAVGRASCAPARDRFARRTIALVALLAAIASVGGCGSSGSSSSANGAHASAPLIVAINSGVTSLDPARACTAFYDYPIVKNMYDPLVDYGQGVLPGGKREIVPSLATSWKVNSDKTTYTFQLRHGVTFSSGNPLTSADVVYSLKRSIAAEGCQAFVLTFNDKIKEIAAPGPYEVRIGTAEPDPLLLDQLAQTGTGPLDQKTLQAHGGLSTAGDNWIATHSAGTGAYVLSSDQPNNEIVLTARKDYWKGAPNNGGLDFRVVTDPTTLATLARSGQADIVYGIPLKEVSSMKSSGRKIIAEPVPYYAYLGLNNKVAPLNNQLVRRAIATAMPLRNIAGALGYGHVHTYVGPIPPAMPFYPSLPVSEPSIAQAKSLMKQAGVSSAHITIDVIQGKQEEAELATVVQAALRPIGISATINTLGSSAFFSAVEGFKAQAYLLLDGSPLNDPAYLLGYMVACGNAFNWPQYCNQQIQPLLPRAATATAPKTREQLYRQISQIFVQDPGYVPIFSPEQVIVADATLTGYVGYPDGQTVFWPIAK